MQHGKLIRWVLGALLGAALLPVGLAAQDAEGTSDEQTTQQVDRKRRHRQFHRRARERFTHGRRRVMADRQAYRRAVDEYGKDSPQARRARARLRKDSRRLKQTHKRFAQQHRRIHRRHRRHRGQQ